VKITFLLLGLLTCCSLLFADGVPAEIRERLQRAEENVRLAEATERRIERGLDALRADPDSDPTAVTTMERYLEEVRSIRGTHEKALDDLRALAGNDTPITDPVVEQGLREFEASLASLPKAEDPVDEMELLDREFEKSLGAFDKMIEEHLARVRTAMDTRLAQASAAATGPAQAAAEAAALLRGMGVDPGVPGGKEPGVPGGKESGEPTAGSGTPASPAGENTGTSGAQGTPGTPGSKAGAGGGGSRPERQDEDIVARQLREAAENETDPVLREKLWKEYEAYLDGRS
jgi:hypothetical protein